MVFSPRSFGDDIPGMEGLGTGEVTLLKSHLMVHRSIRSGALHLFLVSLFQISPSFAPGRPLITWSCTSWLSTASSEPFLHAPCNPLGILGHHRTSNHLPQAPHPRV